MRRPIAIAAAVGALAVGGTAIAAPGGGPLGGLLRGDPEERQAELARDLASKLDGVSAGQIERALGQVRRERRAERHREMARGLASKLDGVSVEEAQRALERSHAQMRERFRSGRPPETGPFALLAKELGKSRQEVRRAFREIHRERLDRELDQAVKEGRLTREQADRIGRHAEHGPPRVVRRRFGHGPPPPGVEAPAGPPPGDFVMPAPGPPPME